MKKLNAQERKVADRREYVTTKYRRLSRAHKVTFTRDELQAHLETQGFLAKRDALLVKRNTRTVARILCDKELDTVTLADLVLEINKGNGFKVLATKVIKEALLEEKGNIEETAGEIKAAVEEGVEFIGDAVSDLVDETAELIEDVIKEEEKIILKTEKSLWKKFLGLLGL